MEAEINAKMANIYPIISPHLIYGVIKLRMYIFDKEKYQL